MIGIYKITNIANGKCYIGQSKNINQRWQQHKSELNGDRHHCIGLQRAWNKYGSDSFKWEVLEECNIEELDDKEKYYIKLFNSYSKGYNNTPGGYCVYEGLTKRQKKEKQKILHDYRIKDCVPIVSINIKTNEIKYWDSARWVAHTLGIHQSCIYNCLVKKIFTYKGYIWMYKDDYDLYGCNKDDYLNKRNQKRAIVQYDINGNFIKEYDSIAEASLNCIGNKRNSSIVKCCKGQRSTAHGFVWRYKGEPFNKYPIHIAGTNVLQYDLNNNFLEEYNSIIEASKKLNISVSSISNCCIGLSQTAGGFKWKYKSLN